MAAKLKALLQWCKVRADGYRDVNITNFTSSFKSGLAFCAIIHRYRPDLIDYDSLKKEDVYENNKLAFRVAQEQLGIPALLDAEDMVAMAVPDKLCIVTYVSQYYNYFQDKQPATGGAPKRIATKRPQTDRSSSPDQQTNKKPTPPQVLGELDVQSGVTNKITYGDVCSMCNMKVFLLERHIQDDKLYHRRCVRELERNQLSESLKRGLQASKATKGFELPSDKENYNNTVSKLADQKSKGTNKVEESPNPFKQYYDDKVKPSNWSSSHLPEKHAPVAGSQFKPYSVSSRPTQSSSSSQPSNSHQAFHSDKSFQLKSSHSSFTPYKTSTSDQSSSATHPLPASSFLQSSDTPYHLSEAHHSAVQEIKRENEVKNSLLLNLTKIRQTAGDDKPSGGAQRPNGLDVKSEGKKSALAVNLDAYAKKSQSTTPSTPPHMIGLSSPLHYKSIFSDNMSNLPESAAKTEGIKPILKNRDDSEERNSRLQSRSILKTPEPHELSGSPPRSILKHGHDGHADLHVRVASPEGHSIPRSILKNSSRSNSQERRSSLDLATTPPKSILKSKLSSTEDLDDLVTPELSMSPPRSILKNADDGFHKDSVKSILKKHTEDENIRPILRKSSEEIDLDLLVEANLPTKPILKKHSIDKSDEEFPKPILKHNESEKPAGQADRWKRQPSSEKQAGLTTLVVNDVKQPLSNGAAGVNSAFADVKPKISNTAEHQKEKIPEWQLEAQKRQAVRGDKYADPEKPKSDTQENVRRGSTDTFLRSQGVFFSASPLGERKLNNTENPKDSKILSQTDTNEATAKPSKKLGATDLILLPQSNAVNTELAKSAKGTGRSNVPSATDPVDNRPAWQIEAEKRQAMRKGFYPDPEKNPASARPKTDKPAQYTGTNSSSVAKHESVRLTVNTDRNTANTDTKVSSITKPNVIASSTEKTDRLSKPAMIGDHKREAKLNKPVIKPALKNGTVKSMTGRDTSLLKPYSFTKPIQDTQTFTTTKGPAAASASNITQHATDKTKPYTAKQLPESKTANRLNGETSGQATKQVTKDIFNKTTKPDTKICDNATKVPAKDSKVSTVVNFDFHHPDRLHHMPGYRASNITDSKWKSDSPTHKPQTSSNMQISPTQIPPAVNKYSTDPPVLNMSNVISPYLSRLNTRGVPERTSSPSTESTRSGGSSDSLPSFSPTSPSRPPWPSNGTQSTVEAPYSQSWSPAPSAVSHISSTSNYSDRASPYPSARPHEMPRNEPQERYWEMSGSNRSSSNSTSGTSQGTIYDNNQYGRSVSLNEGRKKKGPAPSPPSHYVSQQSPGPRKVTPNQNFYFESNEFDVRDPAYSELEVSRRQQHQASRASVSPSAPPRTYRMIGRPLPPVPAYGVRRRTVSAEKRISPAAILEKLQQLDIHLRQLEQEGCQLETMLRDCPNEPVENELLNSWFELINKKNDLVREEADLVYKQRQQELEDIHEELEYELRLLMAKPDNQKTSSERIREDALLQELLFTVSQRNSIVDSMEEDRLRYLEEDENIAEVLRTKSVKGFSSLNDEDKSVKGKKGKKSKQKRDKKSKSKHKKKK